MKIKQPQFVCTECDHEWVPRAETKPDVCRVCRADKQSIEVSLPDSTDKFMLPHIVCNSCGHEWTPREESLPSRCRECMKTDYTLTQVTGKKYIIRPGERVEV